MPVSDLDPRPNASTSLDPSNPPWNAPAGFRLGADVYFLTGSGAPTDGTSGTGAGFAGKNSSYSRTDANGVYYNTGTLASPTWTALTIP